MPRLLQVLGQLLDALRLELARGADELVLLVSFATAVEGHIRQIGIGGPWWRNVAAYGSRGLDRLDHSHHVRTRTAFAPESLVGGGLFLDRLLGRLLR